MAIEHERGTVWIVEDSPLEAEMARRALAPTQDTEVLNDGSLALERFAAGSIPDVIVLDWQLPSVSGVDVCRVLRGTHDANALPILMLTAQGRKQDVSFAIAAGANDYVTKPYDVAELVARVQTLVRTSHLQRAQERRARQAEFAADIGALLTQAATVREIAERCTERLAAHTEAPLAGVWFKRGDELKLGSPARRDDEASDIAEQVVAEASASQATCVRGGIVAVPLIVGDAVVGVVAVGLARSSEQARASLEEIAHLVALGVARVRSDEERTELLERERTARSDAERANRSKDEFLAIVSHELRTPLNAIAGWATMLTSGIVVDPASTKRAIETIERNARAQAQLIEDLLDVSRIASGKLHLEKSTIDLASVAELAIESVRLAAAARSIRLESNITSGLPPVRADADRIKQVVLNLLGNAIKFTPTGGKVSLVVEAAEGAVDILVTDTGKGIEPAFLPFIFDRFRQADGSVTRSAGGLGLGLAIVRHIVELHDGAIEAASEGLGKGASFRVRLPADAERLIVKHNGGTTRSSVPFAEFPGLRGLRVLVVDDETDARELLTALLEPCGIEVTACSGAAKAFTTLQEIKPDVLLSDVGMPVEDGLTLMRRVRALPSEAGGNVHAIALTAYARREDKADALRAGFDSYLPKPIQAADLYALLANVTGR